MNTEKLTFVIFGATGDLAKKKLVPALYDLYINSLLPANFEVVGFSRKDFSHRDYQDFVLNILQNCKQDLKLDIAEKFISNFFYVSGDLNNSDSYDKLSKYLKEKDETDDTCSNKIFYLAVPPNLYESTFSNLGSAKLVKGCKGENNSWTRVLVEKPFGHNQEQAKKLDKMLGKLFDESQVFRIDHYLAKEALQNIITFRFANAIFEPLWSKEFIQKVEIKLHETGDISGRENFYDDIGALRDVGQNHILQMIALVAMEDPRSTKSDLIRNTRRELISRIEPYEKRAEDYAFRAQYNGYQDIGEIKDTETFFRLKLNINNKRWDGVPFYVESGKALEKDLVEIKVTFKDKESSICRDLENCSYNNTLTFEIQPKQKISICFWVKNPNFGFDVSQKDLEFMFDSEKKTSDAYERVLFDCLRGDQTLFPSTEEVAIQWALISRITNDWQKIPLNKYEKGINPEKIK